MHIHNHAHAQPCTCTTVHMHSHAHVLPCTYTSMLMCCQRARNMLICLHWEDSVNVRVLSSLHAYRVVYETALHQLFYLICGRPVRLLPCMGRGCTYPRFAGALREGSLHVRVVGLRTPKFSAYYAAPEVLSGYFPCSIRPFGSILSCGMFPC